MNSNEILEAFNFRYACKEFNPSEKISDEKFQMILEAGRLSPSSFGLEPWKFLVVQNLELRDKIKDVSWGAQGQLPTASHFIVILARKFKDTVFNSKYIDSVMREVQNLPEEAINMRKEFIEKFQKFDFDLSDDRKLFDWACKQTYIALGNMMTVGALLGVDSCPIEGFDREKLETLLSNEKLIDREHFGVSVLVGFGYRAENSIIHEKTRGKKENIIEWVK